MLLLGNALAEEVNVAKRENGKKGRKVIANILSGHIIRKYQLKSLVNKRTGINQRQTNSGPKKCDRVPRQLRQPVAKEKTKNRVIEFLK